MAGLLAANLICKECRCSSAVSQCFRCWQAESQSSATKRLTDSCDRALRPVRLHARLLICHNISKSQGEDPRTSKAHKPLPLLGRVPNAGPIACFLPDAGAHWRPSCSPLCRLPLSTRCCAAPLAQPDCATSSMWPWQGTESARLAGSLLGKPHYCWCHSMASSCSHLNGGLRALPAPRLPFSYSTTMCAMAGWGPPTCWSNCRPTRL